MGAYTTLRITRSKAKAVVIEDLLRSIDSDDFLEQQLDRILGARLYSAIICDDADDSNDDGAL